MEVLRAEFTYPEGPAWPQRNSREPWRKAPTLSDLPLGAAPRYVKREQ